MQAVLEEGAEAGWFLPVRRAITTPPRRPDMLQRFVDPAAVAAEIERVRSLSGHALRRRWQAVFGRSVPEHLTADLLRRMIANRIQEEAFGTLDRAIRRHLQGDGTDPRVRP